MPPVYLITEQAQSCWDALEAAGPESHHHRVFVALQDVCDQLEENPGDPRLHCRQYSLPELQHVHTVPIPGTDWVVLWSLASDNAIEVTYIGPPELPGHPPLPQ